MERNPNVTVLKISQSAVSSADSQDNGRPIDSFANDDGEDFFHSDLDVDSSVSIMISILFFF